MTRTLQEQLVKNGLAVEGQEKTRKQRRKERLERYRKTGSFGKKKSKTKN